MVIYEDDFFGISHRHLLHAVRPDEPLKERMRLLAGQKNGLYVTGEEVVTWLLDLEGLRNPAPKESGCRQTRGTSHCQNHPDIGTKSADRP